MDETPGPRYTLDEVRAFKAALGGAIDRMDAEPYEGGEFERKIQLRQTGLSLHVRWTPKLPILPPATPPHVCTQNFADIGLNPGLMHQVLDQLEELLADG